MLAQEILHQFHHLKVMMAVVEKEILVVVVTHHGAAEAAVAQAVPVTQVLQEEAVMAETAQQTQSQVHLLLEQAAVEVVHTQAQQVLVQEVQAVAEEAQVIQETQLLAHQTQAAVVADLVNVLHNQEILAKQAVQALLF
jgi:hypothetical protein